MFLLHLVSAERSKYQKLFIEFFICHKTFECFGENQGRKLLPDILSNKNALKKI